MPDPIVVPTATPRKAAKPPIFRTSLSDHFTRSEKKEILEADLSEQPADVGLIATALIPAAIGGASALLGSAAGAGGRAARTLLSRNRNRGQSSQGGGSAKQSFIKGAAASAGGAAVGQIAVQTLPHYKSLQFLLDTVNSIGDVVEMLPESVSAAVEAAVAEAGGETDQLIRLLIERQLAADVVEAAEEAGYRIPDVHKDALFIHRDGETKNAQRNGSQGGRSAFDQARGIAQRAETQDSVVDGLADPALLQRGATNGIDSE